jgi:hypothetical protein
MIGLELSKAVIIKVSVEFKFKFSMISFKLLNLFLLENKEIEVFPPIYNCI